MEVARFCDWLEGESGYVPRGGHCFDPLPNAHDVDLMITMGQSGPKPRRVLKWVMDNVAPSDEIMVEKANARIVLDNAGRERQRSHEEDGEVEAEAVVGKLEKDIEGLLAEIKDTERERLQLDEELSSIAKGCQDCVQIEERARVFEEEILEIVSKLSVSAGLEKQNIWGAFLQAEENLLSVSESFEIGHQAKSSFLDSAADLVRARASALTSDICALRKKTNTVEDLLKKARISRAAKQLGSLAAVEAIESELTSVSDEIARGAGVVSKYYRTNNSIDCLRTEVVKLDTELCKANCSPFNTEAPKVRSQAIAKMLADIDMFEAGFQHCIDDWVSVLEKQTVYPITPSCENQIKQSLGAVELVEINREGLYRLRTRGKCVSAASFKSNVFCANRVREELTSQFEKVTRTLKTRVPLAYNEISQAEDTIDDWWEQPGQHTATWCNFEQQSLKQYIETISNKTCT
mmetsp:Transcript_9229/g.17425  ORF Transcript_9229/g.17425 Transcript_9229/m.17425 type:complete len:463 (-) Transcript_9229:2434-3822(-)